MEQFSEKFLELISTLGTWDNLLQIATLFLLYFGADNQIVNAVNWLKERLGWDSKKAELLVITMAVLVSIATLLVQGLITPEALTVANFATLIGTVTYTAQKRYQTIKNDKNERKVEYVEAKTDAIIEKVHEDH